MKKPPCIMVVDDEEPIRKLLRVNLSVDGYDVVTASDGSSALELWEEYKPDLVILDIMMPGLDGFHVLDIIRQHSNVPVIMLTARGEVSSVFKAMSVFEADDYIRKPFSMRELSTCIQARLRRAIPEVRQY